MKKTIIAVIVAFTAMISFAQTQSSDNLIFDEIPVNEKFEAPMDLTLLRTLFFLGGAVGIFLVVVGARRIYRVFNTRILAQIPMSVESVDFKIQTSGNYSVWIKAPLFQTNHLDKIKPRIYNQDRQRDVPLQYNFFTSQYTRQSGLKNGHLKLYTFKAEQGNYKLETTAGSSLHIPFEKEILKTFLSEANITKCFFQVRENMPPLYGLFGTLMTVFGGVSIFLGLLTNEIWM